MRKLKGLRRTRWVVLLAIAATVVVTVAVSQAATGPAIQTITPQYADDVTNVDVLKQQIKNYYGDPLGTGNFAADSNYAKETQGDANQGYWWLTQRGNPPTFHQKKAIVLDVDDTTLVTYNYEVFSNWAFNPTTNATFVNGELFPAVPGMVDMAYGAKQLGYAIIFLTGRPTSQAAATLGNLTTDDMPPPAIHNHYPTPTYLFLKPPKAAYATDAPWLLPCINDTANGCNTSDYKTLTRKHIEQDLGYDITANFGDQFSDLVGGFADRTFKMPNPSYFLP